eukprot:COSAG05_NODE_111_length_18575_cov_3.808292_15_plen_327_part_00
MGQLGDNVGLAVSNSVIDGHKKALTLVLMLESLDKGLGENLIKSLKSSQAKVLLNLVKQKPLMEEKEIVAMVDSAFQILVDKNHIMAESGFVSSIGENIDPEDDFRRSIILNNQSLLSLFSEDFLKSLGDNKACIGLALLCKLAKKQDVIRVMKILPDEIAQDVLLKYVRIKSTSLEMTNEFTSFMLEKLSQEKESLTQLDPNVQLASILEQSQPDLIKLLRKNNRDIDWKDVESKMFKLEDLSVLESSKLDQVLDVFSDPKELGLLLNRLPDAISGQLKSRLTDRKLGMIKEEQSDIEAMDEEEASEVMSKLVAIVRDQEQEGSS